MQYPNWGALACSTFTFLCLHSSLVLLVLFLNLRLFFFFFLFAWCILCHCQTASLTSVATGHAGKIGEHENETVVMSN